MYDQNHSFDAQESPPHENGLYWVCDAHGKTTGDPIEWRDGKWLSELSVTRYSGDDVRQRLTRQVEFLKSVLAGVALMQAPDDLPEKRNSQVAALKLARHFASAAARQGISADSAARRQRNAFGFYVVAQQLGLSFDESLTNGPVARTDRVLMSAFGGRFPDVRTDVMKRARLEHVTGDFTEWARSTVDERKKVEAKRLLRLEGGKPAASTKERP